MGPLLAASLEGLALALIGIGLFQFRRRAGLTLFIFAISAAALTLGLTSHLSGLTLEPVGTAPHAFVALVPALLGLFLVTHMLTGWRNAQWVALLPLIAGLVIGVSAYVASLFPLVVPPELLPPLRIYPITAGLAVWAGASLASLGLHWLYRFAPMTPPVVPVIAAGAIGTASVGILLYTGVLANLLLPHVSWPGIVLLPMAAGVVPLVILGFYTQVLMRGLPVDMRQELMSTPPFGTRALLDAYRLAEAQHASAGDAQGQASEDSAYRRLLDVDGDGAYVADHTGKITYANRALGRILDRPEERLAGTNITHLLGAAGPPKPVFATYAITPGVHRAAVPLPSAKKRWVEVTVTESEDGTYQGHVRDLTEDLLRKEVDQEKRRAEFYVDLLRHDIGNYLTMPMAYLSLVENADGLDDEIRRRVQAAAAGIRDVSDLLRRLDVLNNLEQINPEPWDATISITQARERFARSGAEGKARIDIELPDGPVWVRGSALLEEVFVNLIGNARRHAGEDAHIILGADQTEEGSWVFRVDDNGPGVPDDKKKKIFDRFERGSTQGKGLGLYIVRTITEALGGKVWVDDRVEGDRSQGASFRVELRGGSPPPPVQEEDPSVAGVKAETPDAAGANA